MKVPKSFAGFRRQLARVLKKTDLDKRFAKEVGDTGYEGTIAGALFPAWEELERSLKENLGAGIYRMDDGGVYEDMEGVLHDALIEAWDEFTNPWNHEPGWRSPKTIYKSKEVSEQIQQALNALVFQLEQESGS